MNVLKVVKGHNLLAEEFKLTNINSYGTKLLSLVFEKHELQIGQFEPNKRFDQRYKSLDQKRVDLIKACYLYKVFFVLLCFVIFVKEAFITSNMYFFQRCLILINFSVFGQTLSRRFSKSAVTAGERMERQRKLVKHAMRMN